MLEPNSDKANDHVSLYVSSLRKEAIRATFSITFHQSLRLYSRRRRHLEATHPANEVQFMCAPLFCGPRVPAAPPTPATLVSRDQRRWNQNGWSAADLEASTSSLCAARVDLHIRLPPCVPMLGCSTIIGVQHNVGGEAPGACGCYHEGGTGSVCTVGSSLFVVALTADWCCNP